MLPTRADLARRPLHDLVGVPEAVAAHPGVVPVAALREVQLALSSGASNLPGAMGEPLAGADYP